MRRNLGIGIAHNRKGRNAIPARFANLLTTLQRGIVNLRQAQCRFNRRNPVGLVFPDLKRTSQKAVCRALLWQDRRGRLQARNKAQQVQRNKTIFACRSLQ